MSQPSFYGSIPVGPATPTEVAAQQNLTYGALLNDHLGTSRPAYAEQGTFWLKDTESSPLIIEQYFFDGTDDILTGSFNVATNSFTPVFTGAALLDAAQTFTKTQTWTKGGDIASASSLALGDGNYFDITGTTTVTAIATKGTGSVIKLHFDAVLILTHHASNLILPGAANITTAAGDEAEFIEYATGLWRCVSYQVAANVPGGGGALVFISSLTASSDATLSFATGIDSTYDRYIFIFDGLVPSVDNKQLYMRTSTNGGSSYDSGASDYASGIQYLSGGTQSVSANDSDSFCRASAPNVGFAAGESVSGTIDLENAPNASLYTKITTIGTYVNTSGIAKGFYGGGNRKSAADVDAVQFFFDTGNVVSGEIRMYGVAKS